MASLREGHVSRRLFSLSHGSKKAPFKKETDMGIGLFWLHVVFRESNCSTIFVAVFLVELSLRGKTVFVEPLKKA